MEKLKCNLCEADKYKVIIRGKDRLHGIPGEFDYVRCSNCNLVYMNPQLSLKELQKYYPLEYKPYNTIKSQEELSIKKKEKIEQPQLYGNLNKDSRLLDVGCGSGTFIKKIHHITGCKVYGVDISQDAGKDAAGAELFHGTICDAKYKNDFFDAVTAWEYLEHVNNPVEVLNEIYRILKPGGIFMLSCPNYDSFNAKVFKSKWYHLDCPRHLFLYSPNTIKVLLEKCKFSQIKIMFQKSSKGMLGSLQYALFENNYDLKHKDKVRKSTLLKALLSPIARLGNLIGKSDSMVVQSKKCEEQHKN